MNIQQLIFKTINEKSNECNLIWLKEINEDTPHYDVISQLTITLEVLNKTFELFEKNDSTIRNDRDSYTYLFWKQLNTGLRGWIKKAKTSNEYLTNSTYSDQIDGIHSAFENHFE